jgi:methionine sulfoxide reductase heme-binding subunit
VIVEPLLGASGPTVLWYLARGSGIAALVLLTASVVGGILTTVRWSSARWPRFVTQLVHRNVSLLALVFIVIHIVTVVLDAFAPIRWTDAVVPFASAYRPLWLGFGAIGFDLLIALIVTSLLRHRIGQRTWRVLHYSAYVCWPVMVLHGLGSGTDTKVSVVLVLNAVCIALVVLALWWRLATAGPGREGARLAGAAASLVAPLLLFVWLSGGPLAAGWARRSGTPSSILNRARPATP